MFDDLNNTVDTFFNNLRSEGFKISEDKTEPEVVYELTARVDNKIVFIDYYQDTVDIQDALSKVEDAVERALDA